MVAVDRRCVNDGREGGGRETGVYRVQTRRTRGGAGGGRWRRRRPAAGALEGVPRRGREGRWGMWPNRSTHGAELIGAWEGPGGSRRVAVRVGIPISFPSSQFPFPISHSQTLPIHAVRPESRPVSTPFSLATVQYPTLIPPPHLARPSPSPDQTMATVAGRKKSMVASLPPAIDSPIANHTLLNKAASQSTSLYQQCSSLRTRLMHLQDFSDWFSVAALPDSARRSTDPVTQLWDVFALGLPLCYLFNLLPLAASSPIAVETDVQSFDPTNERTKKHAIALFAMNVKQVPGCEGFTVRDLWDRNSTDGFVKVRSTLSTRSPLADGSLC